VDGVAAASDALAVEAADAVYVLRAGHQTTVRLRDVEIDVEHLDGDGLVRAPMHGRLLAVLVDVGAEVHKGQRLAVIEAMKMEHSLLAPVSGKVIEIAAAAGAQVGQGARIMEIEPYGHQGQ
jgi:3-methylcrotonyl-CoA carboxylase alpha subunit